MEPVSVIAIVGGILTVEHIAAITDFVTKLF